VNAWEVVVGTGEGRLRGVGISGRDQAVDVRRRQTAGDLLGRGLRTRLREVVVLRGDVEQGLDVATVSRPGQDVSNGRVLASRYRPLMDVPLPG
jgi:hypothetical protein